jgi:hypothetical protein
MPLRLSDELGGGKMGQEYALVGRNAIYEVHSVQPQPVIELITYKLEGIGSTGWPAFITPRSGVPPLPYFLWFLGDDNRGFSNRKAGFGPAFASAAEASSLEDYCPHPSNQHLLTRDCTGDLGFVNPRKLASEKKVACMNASFSNQSLPNSGIQSD